MCRMNEAAYNKLEMVGRYLGPSKSVLSIKPDLEQPVVVGVFDTCAPCPFHQLRLPPTHVCAHFSASSRADAIRQLTTPLE